MTLRELLSAFEAWRAEQQPLVLASVFETRGSTYSKAGARMLIAGNADFQGMLSGGCLEGDLAERAAAVLRSGTPQSVTYDLGKNDEELWGLGVGCDGLMRIFLQPVLPDEDYQPFTAMARVLAGDAAGVAATVLESPDPRLKAGATVILGDRGTQAFGVPDDCREALEAAAQSAATEKISRSRDLVVGERSISVLVARLLPPPRLLVLGAGLDSLPVLRMAWELGWRVTLQDHRPAYIERGDFRHAEQVFCEPADEIDRHIDMSRYDGVIVMSHHLATDRSYLKLLAGSQIPYVGLLGPPDRRRRLMEDLGDLAGQLDRRLHGPAGFDIGADGPASIALSILAEMHSILLKQPR